MHILYLFVALLSYAITLHCEMFSADADVRLARRIKRDTADNAREIGAVLDQVATVRHTICTSIIIF